MMKTAKLLLHCPDKPGILAEVTDFITVNKGNIIYLDQYVDHVENIFFMRIEWELKDFLVPQEKIEDYFATLYAQKYEMNFRLYFSDAKPRMAIFVSKMSHCLFDLLARYTAGECGGTFRHTFPPVPYHKGNERRAGEERNGTAGQAQSELHRAGALYAGNFREDDRRLSQPNHQYPPLFPSGVCRGETLSCGI